jgi:hypothetical protein
MAILITHKVLTLEKLTEALLTSRATGSQVADAVDAIRRANPGLIAGRLPKGTPLVVPPFKNARVDVSAVARRVDEDLTGAMEAVDQLQPFAERNRDRVAARVEELSTQLKALSRGNRGTIDRATATTALGLLEDDLSEAEALVTTWSDAVPGWQASLEKLQQLRTGSLRPPA